jgi:hypothetical protein
MKITDPTQISREKLLATAASFERQAAELRTKADRLDAWAAENRERAAASPSHASA